MEPMAERIQPRKKRWVASCEAITSSSGADYKYLVPMRRIHFFFRSLITSRLALSPGAPVKPPPG